MKFEVKDQGEEVSLVFEKASLSADELSKQIHDLRSAIRTIGICSSNIEAGYKFDDDRAEAKIRSLCKASAGLESQGMILEEVLAGLLKCLG